jgi:predicted nucleic acid-binding protein
MEMSSMGLFRAKWTDDIHDEWISSLLKNRSDLSREKLIRTRDLMNQAVADCLVRGYEPLISGLDLPDKDDRHILAAAIHCNADAIITFDLKDFPLADLAQYGIEPQHPDDFVFHQFGINEASVLNAARRCRARLKNPPREADQYLVALERCGLPQSVDRLREYTEII